MKINKIRPFKDVIVVDEAETIRSLSDDEKIDRQFKLHGVLNLFTIKRSLRNLSYNGTRFPHMLPRNDAVREMRHTELWNSFNAKAVEMAAGAEELELIAKWILGETPDVEPGILAQQIIGQFFDSEFRATKETWEAAIAFHEEAASKSLTQILWWKLIGKGFRAKKLLASAVNNDIVAMHGIGVAVHNLVASINKLKEIYKNSGTELTPEEAVDAILSAPPVVLRQAAAEGKVGGCPFSKFTFFQLKLKDANADNKAKDLIFMSNSWSRCPAEQWVPAVILGIWKRVILHSNDNDN